MNTTQPKKKSFFKSDRGVLSLSIFLAFLLWFLLKMSQSYTYSENINITYNVPHLKSILNSPPASLNAEFTGSGWQLLKLSFQKTSKTIQFKLTNNKSQVIGSSNLVNSLKNLDFGDGVVVNKFDLDLIQIELEDKSEKRVPIKLKNAPKIAPGFVLLKPFTFSPDSITITGPQSHINDLSFISPILKADIVYKSNEVSTLILDNPYPDYVSLSADKTDMSTYVEQLIEKSIYLPIELTGVIDSIQMFPTIVKTTFNLPLKFFNDINASDFDMHADFSNRSSTKMPLALLKHPKYINNIKFDVDSIEYLLVKPVE